MRNYLIFVRFSIEIRFDKVLTFYEERKVTMFLQLLNYLQLFQDAL